MEGAAVAVVYLSALPSVSNLKNPETLDMSDRWIVRASRITLTLLVALSLVAVAACGPDEAVVAAAARAEEWTAIEASRATLQEKRAELAGFVSQMAADAEEVELPEGQTIDDFKADLQAKVNNLQAETERLSQELEGRLVAFINDAGLVQGEEIPPEVQSAFRMRSSEALLVADEYGDKGGDWARAIAIAQDLLKNDPENEEIQARLDHYNDMRYMSEERFAAAEVGMTPDEVIAVLGVPGRGNDRDFDNGTRAFFYLTGEDRGAAAVYFRERSGEMQAYKVDYTAIQPQSE